MDSTMTEIEYNLFFKKYNRMIVKYCETTEMTHNEVSCIMLVYYKFVLQNGRDATQITKDQMETVFYVLFNFNDSEIIGRIITVIADDPKFISPHSWLLLFRVFITGDLNVRMRYAFEIYDVKGLGYLTSEHVSYAVDKFFSGDDEDLLSDLRMDMMELIFNKMDVDKDGLIDFNEYSAVVTKQPDLLEFLGRVFPEHSHKVVLAHCLNIECELGYITADGIKMDVSPTKRDTKLIKERANLNLAKVRKSDHYNQKWFALVE